MPLSFPVFLASKVLSTRVPTMIATVGAEEKIVFNMLLNCKTKKKKTITVCEKDSRIGGRPEYLER